MTRKTPDRLDAYRRLAKHERGLWLTTIAIVVMTGATIAILTVGASIYGAFEGQSHGFVLAGACLVLLALFIVYVAMNRQTLEENRIRILRELESRSSQLGESNQALEQALKTREVFLNSVSHELKTPLTAMLAYAEFMTDESLPAEDTRGYASHVLTEGQNLLRLIEQLVDVSTFDAGVIQLRWAQSDLVGILGKAFERVTAQAAERKVAVASEVVADQLEAWVDAGRIQEVLITLLQNAIGNSGNGDAVRVRMRYLDEDWLEINVEDSVRRLSSEERIQLFQPFGKLNPQPEGREGDLGLALPLAKRVVMAHGGLLGVTQLEPKGIRFALLLPRESAGAHSGISRYQDPEEATSLKRAG